MIRLVGLVILMVLAATLVEAQPASCAGATITCKATTGNYADVVTMVGTMGDGDIGIIPLGSWTWTESAGQRLTVGGVGVTTKGIHLRGDPNGQTILTTAGSTCSNANNIITLFEDATHHVELSDITFREGGGTCSGSSAWFVVEIRPNNGKPVRIHDNNCAPPTCVRGFKFYVDRGIVYENTWVATSWHGAGNDNNTRQFVSCAGSQSPWNSLPNYGTADSAGTRMLYLEDNIINGPTTTSDFFDGCRAVMRYNELSASHFGAHGLDSGGGGSHSMRHGESYENDFFTLTDPVTSALNTGFVAWHSLRGGSWRIFRNRMPNFTHGFGANAARLFSLSTSYGSVFWSCWGTASNPLHGTAGTNNFAGFQYPLPEQTALGWNGGSTGSNFSVASHPSGAPLPGYIIEGIYVWDNTGTSTTRNSVVLGSSATGCPSPDAHSGYIQMGRDWFNAAPAGYHPCDASIDATAAGLGCEYPHHCRHDVAGAGCGLTGPVDENDPPILSITTPPFYDTAAATADITGTVTDDETIVSMTWTNSTGGSGPVTSFVGNVFTIAAVALTEAVNTVTVSATDNDGLVSTAAVKVRRQTCTGGLPFTDAFTSSEAWPTIGPCYVMVGSGQTYTIASNQATQTAAGVFKMALYTGQALTQQHSVKATIQTINPSPNQKALRLCVAASGTPGQDNDRQAYFLQVEGTGTAKWLRYKAGALDHDYGTLPTTNVNGATWTVVAGTTTATAQILNGDLYAFIDDIQVGAPIVARLPAESGLTDGGLFVGVPALCPVGAGVVWDTAVFANAIAVADDEAPSVEITTEVPGVSDDTPLTLLEVTALDNVGVVACDLFHDRFAGATPLTDQGDGLWSVANVPLATGPNTLTVICRDAQGLQATDATSTSFGEDDEVVIPGSLRGIF